MFSHQTISKHSIKNKINLKGEEQLLKLSESNIGIKGHNSGENFCNIKKIRNKINQKQIRENSFPFLFIIVVLTVGDICVK